MKYSYQSFTQGKLSEISSACIRLHMEMVNNDLDKMKELGMEYLDAIFHGYDGLFFFA